MRVSYPDVVRTLGQRGVGCLLMFPLKSPLKLYPVSTINNRTIEWNRSSLHQVQIHTPSLFLLFLSIIRRQLLFQSIHIHHSFHRSSTAKIPQNRIKQKKGRDLWEEERSVLALQAAAHTEGRVTDLSFGTRSERNSSRGHFPRSLFLSFSSLKPPTHVSSQKCPPRSCRAQARVLRCFLCSPRYSVS